MTNTPKPEKENSAVLSGLLGGIQMLLFTAFALICYFKTIHTMTESNKRQSDAYMRVIDGLNELLDKRRDCYCEPESE